MISKIVMESLILPPRDLVKADKLLRSSCQINIKLAAKVRGIKIMRITRIIIQAYANF